MPLWLVRAVAGDSLVAIRLIAAAAMGVTVWLIGRLTDDLGGGRFARILAMTCGAVAPVYLAIGSYYSMNAFDVLLWTAASWLLLRALRSGAVGPWIACGVVAGLGLENKISMLWLLGGLSLGVLITEPRQWLRPGPWLAAGIAAMLFAPYVLWQVRHDWATLEFIRQASASKMMVQSPSAFLTAQILNMHPATLPVWLAGLWSLLGQRNLRQARPLGVMFVAVLALLMLNDTSRASYLAPAFAPLFAAGACWWEPRLSSRWRTVVIAGLVVLGAAVAPLAMPTLPVDQYVRYAAALGEKPSTDEKKEVSDLPQFFADRFGWQAWADATTAAYLSLPEDERTQAVILTSNYGEAGAIDVLTKGLPPAMSGHNNYWFWGPGTRRGDVVIALLPSSSRADLERLFEAVEVAGTIDCEHCMPYENHRPIFIGRHPRQTLATIWPQVKHFD
ncbi:MAG: glycosyltransferase family 39 protein [Caldimonas sp.]